MSHANESNIVRQPHVYSKAEGYQPDPKFVGGEFPKMVYKKQEGKAPLQRIVKDAEEEAAAQEQGYHVDHAPSF